MPWFKIDDGFHGHPKVVELTLGAVGLWTLAGSWCAKYLTDGFVPTKTVIRLGGSIDEALELEHAGLWYSADGGHQFKDWADYQPLKADVEAERFAAQERMRKVRAAKKGVRPNTAGTSIEPPLNVGRSSEEVPVAPSQSQSHPSPFPSPGESAGRKKPETALPADWAPTASHYERAKESQVNVVQQAELFRLHAESKDRRAVNWNAAFTSWLIKAKPEQKKGGDPLWALRM